MHKGFFFFLLVSVALVSACPTTPSPCTQDKDCSPPQRCVQQRCAVPDASERTNESTQENNQESIQESAAEPATERDAASLEVEPTAEIEPTQETKPEPPKETTYESEPQQEAEPLPEPKPETAPAGSLGSPCQQDNNCNQGRCLDIVGLGQKLCSATCKKDADCPSNGYCDRPVKAWDGFCMPACQRNQDCASLFPHIPQCASEGHCWIPKKMGDTCLRKDECETGLSCVDPGGIGEKICTKVCTEDPMDPKAPCGGSFFCEAHQGAGSQGYCIPLCNKPDDCRPFPSIPNCNIEKHCWRPYLQDFRLCTEPTLCLSGLCAQPKELQTTVCTYECEKDADCPLRTFCSKSPPQTTGHCLPSCTTHDDCSGYTDLRTCETNGYCR